jgi:hypothetical protein
VWWQTPIPYILLLSYFSMNKALHIYRKIYAYYFKSKYFKIKLNLTLVLNISNLKTNTIQVRFLLKLIFPQNQHQPNLSSHARVALPAMRPAQMPVAKQQNVQSLRPAPKYLRVAPTIVCSQDFSDLCN